MSIKRNGRSGSCPSSSSGPRIVAQPPPRAHQQEQSDGLMPNVLRRVAHFTCVAAFTALIGCDNRTADTVSDRQDYDIISFHWPAEQPDSTVRMCTIAATGEQIALKPEPVVGVSHFQRAYLANPADNFVTVQLTEAGRAALARATATRVGQRLAFVVNDTVVALPVINRALDVPELPLAPLASPAAAESVAARINLAIARSRKRN